MTAAEWYRVKALETQRQVAEASARARSYAAALAVYKADCVPLDRVAHGKRLQTGAQEGYRRLGLWLDALPHV